MPFRPRRNLVSVTKGFVIGALAMPRFAAVIVALAIALGAAARADAGIVVTVDKTAQRLTVEIDGYPRYDWAVSTARWGYRTPNGSYRPERLERQWYSRKYDWSPMPHSIFFHGGYAIHGSYEVSRLGRPASHGCIRLHPQNAAVLFDLVRRNMGDTRIVVTGGGPELMARSRERYIVRHEEWREVGPSSRREAQRGTSRARGYSSTFEEIFGDGRR